MWQSLYWGHYRARRALAAWRARWRARGTRPGAPVISGDGRGLNLLFVLTGLLGDVVMCTATLAVARKRFPQATLVALTYSSGRELLAPSKLVDEFIVLDGSPFPLRPSRIRAAAQAVRVMREKHFQVAIILLGDDVAPMLCDALIPVRVGREGTPYNSLLTDTYTIGSPRAWNPQSRLSALGALGVQAEAAEPRLGVSEAARERVDRLLDDAGIPGHARVIALHPFASSASRSLPSERILTMAARLRDACDAEIAIVGSSPLALPRAGAHRIHAFSGTLALSDTCALIARSQLCVSTDSGPMHIACALGVPTVGLFRAIRPEYATLYSGLTAVMWPHGTACLPGCSWDSLSGCRVVPCRQLVGIRDEDVAAAALSRIAPTQVFA